MVEKEVGKYSVKYLGILDQNGKVDSKLMPKISSLDIKKIYELMVLTRTFDDKAIAMQRQGRIGTYASIHGQEACQIPSAIQMKDGDLAFPAFREHGLFLTRGAPVEMLLQFWGGDERGMNLPSGVNVFPVAITVGGHLPHAVGCAMGYKMQGQKNVTLVYFGDGATSEGDFHEAMNMAGAFKAPVVFFCQNNQYAISTPVKEQTASETIAQKAIAYGFEGIQVDGNDVFAVYSATEKAIKKARAGEGPTFIECFTYRMGDHTTSDDAKKYRSETESKSWEAKDPILRLKKYMISKKMFSDKYEKSIQDKSTKIVSEGVDKFEKMPAQDPTDMFKYTFEELTPELKDQMAEFSAGAK